MAKPTLKDYQEGLKSRKERLKDVQERGDDAISEHDLRNGYDANFYLNVCPMLQNQVNWYQNKVNELSTGQLRMF